MSVTYATCFQAVILKTTCPYCQLSRYQLRVLSISPCMPENLIAEPPEAIIGCMAAPGTRPSSTSGSAARPAHGSQDFGSRVHGFWERVTEGLALTELWNQFKTETRTGYRLYSREIDTEQVAGRERGERVRYVLKSLFWAIMMKLSPARRIVLLIGFVLLVMPMSLHFGNLTFEASGIHVVGGLIILGLLLLEVADRVTLKRDLQIAREIQTWLIPEKPPSIPGMEMAFFNRPANTVAGDYYDVFRRDGVDEQHGPVLIMVADVAGKSLPAALLMATLQASLHTLSARSSSITDLMTGLNHYACKHSSSGRRFTTAFLAEYDPQSGILQYINAGHNAPILQRTGGSVERLEAGGVPLGINPLAPYQSGTTTLHPGDTLIIFTDGFIEAVDINDNEWGEQRLASALDANRSQPVSEMMTRMVRVLDAFVGSTPQHDDITCVIARRALDAQKNGSAEAKPSE